MHWTNIGLLVITGLDLGLAFLIWLKNPKHKINIFLSVAIFFLAIWTLGTSMFREAQMIATAVFWGKILNLGGILLVPSFFYFSIYFPYLL